MEERTIMNKSKKITKVEKKQFLQKDILINSGKPKIFPKKEEINNDNLEESKEILESKDMNQQQFVEI